MLFISFELHKTLARGGANRSEPPHVNTGKSGKKLGPIT